MEVFWKTPQKLLIHLRSSHPEVFCQKMLLKILNNSQKKHLCRNLFFNKVAGGKPETARSNHWRYSVKQVLRNEKILGGLPVMWYCQPPWLADEENFSFQIVSNGLKNLIFVGRRYCKFPLINRSLIRNSLESVLRASNFLKSMEVWSLGLKS